MTLSEELMWSSKIGSSRGWVGLKELDGSRVRLTNMFNPCASLSSHKVITLPPLDDSETLIYSISLSASPKHGDCVVAATSCDKSLLLCRPGDSAWTRIEVPCFTPDLMYSERDGKFYLYIQGPLDLLKPSSALPPVRVCLTLTSPRADKMRLSHVTSLKTWFSHLLESETPPSGSYYKKKPKSFVVFRQDPDQNMASYTEDIGDLCIFVGQSEAFRVSATEYPGLKPNSIYYSGYGFGFYEHSP